MIDVENELRQGTVFTPKVFLHTSSDQDFDAISAVNLGYTAGLRVEARAKSDAQLAANMLPVEVSAAAYKEEFERRLMYWAVIYGLSVDDKPAYQYNNPETGVKLDVNHMIDYVENRLGLHREAFQELALDIIEKSGLDYLLPSYFSESEEAQEVAA